ncbi:hypothetical protein Tco_0624937, partial [Tanacetum coccineum]
MESCTKSRVEHNHGVWACVANIKECPKLNWFNNIRARYLPSLELEVLQAQEYDLHRRMVQIRAHTVDADERRASALVTGDDRESLPDLLLRVWFINWERAGDYERRSVRYKSLCEGQRVAQPASNSSCSLEQYSLVEQLCSILQVSNCSIDAVSSKSRAVDSIKQYSLKKEIDEQSQLASSEKPPSRSHLRTTMGKGSKRGEGVVYVTSREAREKFKARTIIGEENMKEPVPRELPPTPFLGHLKEEIGPVHDKEKIVRKEEQDYDIPLHDGVMQPLTPQKVHITPPDDDYVARATSPTLDKQLNEFEEECFDITRVADK